jgi:hypothetical protein
METLKTFFDLFTLQDMLLLTMAIVIMNFIIFRAAKFTKLIKRGYTLTMKDKIVFCLLGLLFFICVMLIAVSKL